MKEKNVIVIIIIVILGMFFIGNPGLFSVFGKLPTIEHTFSEQGAMDLTDVDISKIYMGELSFNACKRSEYDDKLLINGNEVIDLDIAFCGQADSPRYYIKTFNLDSSFFTPSSNWEIDTINEILNEELTIFERIGCLKDSDCVDVSQITVGECVENECVFGNVESPPLQQQPESYNKTWVWVVLIIIGIIIIYSYNRKT